MKKTLKNLKEKWNYRTEREKLAILWILLGISWILDSLHCQILAMHYNCQLEDLLLVMDFYWLSPVFGIIDLLLSILIIKKTRLRMHITIHHFVFNHAYVISVPVIRGARTLLEKGLAIYIAAISVVSLMIDALKFFT